MHLLECHKSSLVSPSFHLVGNGEKNMPLLSPVQPLSVENTLILISVGNWGSFSSQKSQKHGLGKKEKKHIL